jgi:maltose O-acetyltransferase
MIFRSIARDLFDIFHDSARRFALMIVNLLPGSPGNKITQAGKRAILAMGGIFVGKKSQVSGGFYVFDFGRVHFGQHCKIGSNFQIWNFKELHVGDRLLASHNITVICGTHDTDLFRTNIPGPVYIGNDVWIGANVLIVGPAEIGDGVIIGANSYVTGVVPAGCKYGGSPAKLLNSKSNIHH